MNDQTASVQQQSDGSTKMLVTMVGIGIICALLIVMTFQGTKPRIDRLKAEALERAVFEVVPGITSTTTFVRNNDGSFEATAQADPASVNVYAGYDDQGNLKGIAIEASGQGYADIIRILYGYDPAAEAIVGFYVLESKETPGLGDKINKDPAFLANFNELDVSLNAGRDGLENDVVTVKSGTKTEAWEIDGITGATISSRAIGDIINTSAPAIIPSIKKNIDAFKKVTGQQTTLKR
ncbi:FMN-binding protein [Fulvivirga sedimenti]|uniref:Ion-translocating oxidoreductase complex subunit G n=1 Tax=Fulvivirga sedimenti TaxID=2879465 RepID=A0A9X1HN34_9BACT|nr:FMN-binding protein [Fulvivirga sedimenti]MCA6074035.1 FMN-binding protein [Fulvivirga sedimenti]